jgi:hypothetical protein
MFEKISDFDPNKIYLRLSRRKTVGTTTWLANHPDFKRWLSGDAASQRRLWLSGKGMILVSHVRSQKVLTPRVVGSGKSTLVFVEPRP